MVIALIENQIFIEGPNRNSTGRNCTSPGQPYGAGRLNNGGSGGENNQISSLVCKVWVGSID